jgi:hypothetical protein
MYIYACRCSTFSLQSTKRNEADSDGAPEEHLAHQSALLLDPLPPASSMASSTDLSDRFDKSGPTHMMPTGSSAMKIDWYASSRVLLMVVQHSRSSIHTFKLYFLLVQR